MGDGYRLWWMERLFHVMCGTRAAMRQLSRRVSSSCPKHSDIWRTQMDCRSGAGAIIRNLIALDQRWRRSVGRLWFWKTLRSGRFSQHDAVCGAERQFRMFVVRADHSRKVFPCAVFCASKHARLLCAIATATLFGCRHERERVAIPTQSEP